MDPILIFFLLGIVATIAGAKVAFPESISDFLGVMLLIAIGLKGGIELQHGNPSEILPQAALIACMGLILPFLAYPILVRLGRFKEIDAASIAAHYGSVSIGTYAVALAYLGARGVTFEAHTPIFVVILEIPAILVGIYLAKGRSSGRQWSSLLHEIFMNKSIVLLLSGLFIGFVANDVAIGKIKPLFIDLFYGFLSLFLLDMGAQAAKEIKTVLKSGLFLVGFGVATPLVFGSIGVVFGLLAGLSTGGTALIAVLAGSASYIAVPAAMRFSVPEANSALPLGASLGVTFPFNVLFGIPIYYSMAKWIHPLIYT